jgi:hypothetical protein
MDPQAAQLMRHNANSTLQRMDEVSTSLTGEDLISLVGITRKHLAQATALETSRLKIPAELAAIQRIETALDEGSADAAIGVWKDFTSGQLPTFSFTRKYEDWNRNLMADVALYDSCESKLKSLAVPQSQLTHVQELLTVFKCREAAQQKTNTMTFLNSVEPGIRQDVAKDFGMLPTRDDLASWVEVNQRLSGSTISVSAIADTLALKNRYSTFSATSTLISQTLDHQVQSLEGLIASAPTCTISDYAVPSSMSAKSHSALSAQLTKLQTQADNLSKALERCAPLTQDDAFARSVLSLLQPATQLKLNHNAEQFRIGSETLKVINSRSKEIQADLNHLAQVETAHAEEDALKEEMAFKRRTESEFNALGLHKGQSFATVKGILAARGFKYTCRAAAGEGLDQGLWIVGCDGERGTNQIVVTFLMYRTAINPNDMTPHRVLIDKLARGSYVSDPNQSVGGIAFQYITPEEVLGR